MLKTFFCLVLAACLCGTLFVGCGSPGMDEEYMRSGEEIGRERREIFLRAEGNFDGMSAEDRQAYLSSFNNDEEQARAFWNVMANPPTGENRFPQN